MCTKAIAPKRECEILGFREGIVRRRRAREPLRKCSMELAIRHSFENVARHGG